MSLHKHLYQTLQHKRAHHNTWPCLHEWEGSDMMEQERNHERGGWVPGYPQNRFAAHDVADPLISLDSTLVYFL